MVEPNFDDERTVQRARQVVPLGQIETKVRHRRQWLLVGAFAIAMVLGAASALVASYFKLRHVQTTEISQSDSLPVAAAGDTPSTEPAVIEEAEQPAAVPDPSPKKAVAVKHKPVVKPVEELIDPPHEGKVSEDQALSQIRDSVLYDEWQERRARRVSRRERRRDERFHHRDLSNLDEIFEGRRKRPNP